METDEPVTRAEAIEQERERIALAILDLQNGGIEHDQIVRDCAQAARNTAG